MNHTPTPWDLSCHTYDGQQLIDIGTKTTTIAVITEGEETYLEDRANAAFIVRACNMHNELVDMLAEAHNHLDYCGYGDKWERECARDSELDQRIVALLNKARGGDNA